MKTGIIPMTQSGAILGRPGQYKSPPFLMMPGNPVLEEVTLYDFQVNEIPEPEDLNNIPEDYGKELVVVSQRTAKAYTYYCDLDADADWDDTPMWDGSKTAEKKACLEARNMTGDGSQANPWKNLTYALEQLQCFVETQCCRYIRLVCTGTAHYTACAYSSVTYRNTDFSGNGIFILDGANMELSRDGSGGNFFSYCFETCKNSIFYNCTARWKNEASNASAYPILYGFNSCDNSTFYNCTATVTGIGICYGFYVYYSTFYNCTATVTGSDNAYGFYGDYSTFYNCTAEVTVTGSDDEGYRNYYVYGFYVYYSTFYNCTATVTVTGNYNYNYVYGFYVYYSTFYNCTATVTVTGSEDYYYYVYGFYGDQSTFYNCTATVTGIGICYGFYVYYSTFYNCTVTVTSTSTHNTGYHYYYNNYAYGFYGDYSTFCNCTAEVTATTIGTENVVDIIASVYGFRCNNSGVFEKCTYSVSAVANVADSGGSFMEYEYECGIYYDGECQAGYRCERRTEEGTETC